MKKRLFVMALFSTVQLFGENILDSNQNSVKLLESVITTERYDEIPLIETAKNITIITNEDIEKRGYRSIDEALNMIPGVFCTDGVYSIRGQVPKLADKTVVILVDGIPQNGMDNRKYDLDLIPIEEVSKIEVVPSGGAIMYGGNATAGVINIITKDESNKKYYGKIGAEIGSFKHKKFNVKLGGKITDKLSSDIDYSINKKHGYRDREKTDLDYLQFVTKYKITDGYIKVKYNYNKKSGDDRIAALSKKEYEENRKYNKHPGREAKNEENRFNFAFDKKLSNNLEFSSAIEYKDRSYKYNYPEEESIKKKKKVVIPAYTKRDKDTKSLYVNGQLKYNYGENNNIIVGVDYSKAKVKEKIYSYDSKDKKIYEGSDNHIDFKEIGGYALNRLFINKFLLTQGVRVEKNEFNENDILLAKSGMGFKKPLKKEYAHTKYSPTNTDYELTANYLLEKDKSVFLSYNRVKRSPSLTEYSSWDDKESPKKRAQTSNTIELGTKALFDNIYLSGSLFYIHTDKEIMYDPRYGAMSGKSFYNLNGKTERKGIELSSEQYISSLTFRQEFTYMNNKIKSGPYKGNYIPGVPTYMFGLGATYEMFTNILANIEMRYHGKAYASNDYKNEFSKVGSYTLTNISLRYNMENGLSIYGGIKNLFDKKYCNYVYTSQESKKIEMKYSPVPERTYYVGLEYKF